MSARWTGSLLRQHPGLIVSGLYVVASAIGMFYSWAYLREFGINVFDYAQISDFLLASLKEPRTWALVAFALLMVIGDNALSRRLQQRGLVRWLRWYGSARYRMFNQFVAIVLVSLFIFLFADYRADTVRGGEADRVDVTFAGDSEAVKRILLGTTSQFVFLFDAASGRVDVHPIENIHAISFDAPASE